MRNLELLDPLHNTTVWIRQKVLLFGANTTQLSYFLWKANISKPNIVLNDRKKQCHILKDFNNTLSNIQLVGNLVMKSGSQWLLTPRECEVSLKSSYWAISWRIKKLSRSNSLSITLWRVVSTVISLGYFTAIELSGMCPVGNGWSFLNFLPIILRLCFCTPIVCLSSQAGDKKVTGFYERLLTSKWVRTQKSVTSLKQLNA